MFPVTLGVCHFSFQVISVFDRNRLPRSGIATNKTAQRFGHTTYCLPFIKLYLLLSWFEQRVGRVISIWTTYFLAVMAASGIFIMAGWRSKQARGLASTRVAYGLPNDPLWGETEIDLAASPSQADVGAAMRLALKRLTPIMANRSVHAEIAAPDGLVVRMRGAALADLLEEMLAAAIHSAPASRLLLTAARHGDRVYVGITDDMPGADLTVRMGGVRGLMERVAMRGSALDVDVRPAEGTTMTLRLAAMTEEQNRVEWALPTPAKEPAAPLIPLMGTARQLR